MARTGEAKAAGISNPEATSGHGLAAELRRRFSFTRSESGIALLIADGLTYAEIAGRLGISYHTVHTHLKEIHQKLGSTRTAARGDHSRPQISEMNTPAPTQFWRCTDVGGMRL